MHGLHVFSGSDRTARLPVGVMLQQLVPEGKMGLDCIVWLSVQMQV